MDMLALEILIDILWVSVTFVDIIIVENEH